ncbi:glycerophosphodiester phosphodiesterase [Oricola cellulosilytica]|uniref:Glycerophosphodiester phosphodiesterase n=1 Tax=Oricola cellulosilytica TaxID=1429082 RepID=A0A4R0PF16_9HYPH|nr:glycerophosphodiester phosphodiesterase family protein [Oricola cellulosilytica]TCD16415.1 glycerophosphodiester phosphodiesterase [Oricola cellulosilytica]
MKHWLSNTAQAAADLVMAAVPRRKPCNAAMEQCKIVSHRGQHDKNTTARENTLAAFEAARAGGVWGIETDIRWTADLVPVLIHDPDTARVFGPKVTAADVTFAELRAAVPDVPSLAELVTRFGGNTHLMLELKAEIFPEIESQKRILREHLAGLEPGRDYHILALDPGLFETLGIEPRSCCLSVALENMAEIHRRTLGTPYGGITGHYLLLNGAIRRAHEAEGRRVGTGFVASRNCLCREINREVEWIFSNDAVAMQKIVDELRGQ